MYIYGVFRRTGTGYGILLCNGAIDSPALYGNMESAVAWRNEMQRCNDNETYKIYKFALNPNGFTSEDVTYREAAVVEASNTRVHGGSWQERVLAGVAYIP